MVTSAPNCRSVVTAVPMPSVGTPPTANGANKPTSAAPATRSGDKGKITRMVPPNLVMELRRSAAPQAVDDHLEILWAGGERQAQRRVRPLANLGRRRCLHLDLGLVRSPYKSALLRSSYLWSYPVRPG